MMRPKADGWSEREKFGFKISTYNLWLFWLHMSDTTLTLVWAVGAAVLIRGVGLAILLPIFSFVSYFDYICFEPRVYWNNLSTLQR